jgi:hypothetical protein
MYIYMYVYIYMSDWPDYTLIMTEAFDSDVLIQKKTY